VGPLLKKKNQL